MSALQGALDWLRANPALAGLFVYLLTGLLTAAFKPRTPEQYAALPKPVAGFLKIASAIGLDPVKLVEALVTLLKIPGPGDGSPAAPKPELPSVFNVAPSVHVDTAKIVDAIAEVKAVLAAHPFQAVGAAPEPPAAAPTLPQDAPAAPAAPDAPPAPPNP